MTYNFYNMSLRIAHKLTPQKKSKGTAYNKDQHDIMLTKLDPQVQIRVDPKKSSDKGGSQP